MESRIQGIDQAPRRGGNRPGHGTEGMTSMQEQPIPYGYCQCGCGRTTNRFKANDSTRGHVKGEPARYLRGHQFRRDVQERFWEKVDLNGPGGCWLWTAGLKQDGYGHFWDGQNTVAAHRQSYIWAYGPIPEGTEIDHVRARGCSHRNCVNPAHLEAVTHHVNLLRGDAPAARQAAQTHCRRGHPLAGDNLEVDKRGHRRCVICRRVKNRHASRRARLRKKATDA